MVLSDASGNHFTADTDAATLTTTIGGLAADTAYEVALPPLA